MGVIFLSGRHYQAFFVIRFSYLIESFTKYYIKEISLNNLSLSG